MTPAKNLAGRPPNDNDQLGWSEWHSSFDIPNCTTKMVLLNYPQVAECGNALFYYY